MGLGDMLGKVGKAAQKTVDINAKVFDTVADARVKLGSKKGEGYSFFETFSNGIRVVSFTDQGLLDGKKEYPYSEISEIIVTNAPSKLTDGMALAYVEGDTVDILFSPTQAKRMVQALKVANREISKSKNEPEKVILYSPTGSRLELRETYLVLYELAAGLMVSVANIGNQSGPAGRILELKDISATIQPSDDSECFDLVLGKGGEVISSITCLLEDEGTAQAVIDAIEAAGKQAALAPAFSLPQAMVVTGETRTFSLSGEKFEVSAGLDAYNSYRSQFAQYARQCAIEYNRIYSQKVNDLDSFVEFYAEAYFEPLKVLIDQTVGALVLEGIYTVTSEELLSVHYETFHGARDMASALLGAIDEEREERGMAMRGITDFVPHLEGFGFGVSGALKSMAKAEAFNFARDAVSEMAERAATSLTPAQARAYYEAIDTEALSASVFLDYFGAFFLFIDTLQKNGKDIWSPSPQERETAANVFRNLSNPNFPKEQKLNAFLQILGTDPYEERYLDYLQSEFGGSEEATEIIRYFNGE